MQRVRAAWRVAVVATGYLHFDLAQVPGAAHQSDALSREWRQYKGRVKRILAAASAATATGNTLAVTEKIDAEASKRRWWEARAEEKEARADYEAAQRAEREAWEACQATVVVKLAKKEEAS